MPNKAKRAARTDAALARTERDQALLQIEQLAVRREAGLAWLAAYFSDKRLQLFEQLMAQQGLLQDTATAQLAAGKLRLGSARFCHVEASPSDVMQVWLADDLGWIARFELDETLRVDAAKAIGALQAKGFELHMLSGDRDATARQVASRLCIDPGRVQGDCTPQTKLELMQALQQRGRKVLMVGDGLNDGPVLAAANVSVAVGLAVPLAQAQADFVMPGAQLLMLPAMLAHARRTMRIVRQNLWWAAIYNAICVPLALGGWLPAWLAGLGMALSSLLVIANAARLAQLKGGI